MPGGKSPMASFERLSTALRLGVPDRVPVVLVSAIHGAKELGMPLQEYFSRPENVAEGQLRFVQRVGQDNVDAFFFFGREAQAFGTEVIFSEDMAPSAGAPILRKPSDIDSLEVPDPRKSPPLKDVLRATELMAEKARGKWLVVGRALGPFSLPIMLMGLESWLELLLFGDAARRRRLIRVTSKFSTVWANALLSAGANIIALVEPMVSTTMLTREQSTKLVLPVLHQVVKGIRGPVILWSLGSIQRVADLIPDLGVQAVSTDPDDDVRQVKRLVGKQLAVLGGLNDLAMLNWGPSEAEEQVRRAIEAGAPGAGFILSHQYEIPDKVGFEVLTAVVEAAKKWGRYPDDETRIRANQ